METIETKPAEVKEMTFDEWEEKGTQLFGDDPTKWRFQCPNCGHVQTMRDFIDLHDLGIYQGKTPEVAYYSCIGRYDERIPDKNIGTLGDPKEYCDYTLDGTYSPVDRGLIPLVKTVVIGKDARHMVFEFDDTDEGGNLLLRL